MSLTTGASPLLEAKKKSGVPLWKDPLQPLVPLCRCDVVPDHLCTAPWFLPWAQRSDSLAWCHIGGASPLARRGSFDGSKGVLWPVPGYSNVGLGSVAKPDVCTCCGVDLVCSIPFLVLRQCTALFIIIMSTLWWESTLWWKSLKFFEKTFVQNKKTDHKNGSVLLEMWAC